MTRLGQIDAALAREKRLFMQVPVFALKSLTAGVVVECAFIVQRVHSKDLRQQHPEEKPVKKHEKTILFAAWYCFTITGVTHKPSV